MAFIGKLLLANQKSPIEAARGGSRGCKGLHQGSGRGSDSLPRLGYYRILTRQGEGVRNGAKSYIVNGKMTEGFAFVAYPAEYRSSGVMTFIVNEDGMVYQKDLGKNTDVLAKAMEGIRPQFQLAKGRRSAGGDCGGAGKPQEKAVL